MRLTVPIVVDFDEQELKKMIDEYVQEHDIIEVTRCKDCHHFVSTWGVCSLYKRSVDDSDFCSAAEKNNESRI